MTVYVSKTWGFESPSGPLQLRLKGSRDSARAKLRPGDLVVVVGTLGDDTPEAERGKILGLMEPTTDLVSSLEYDVSRYPTHYDEEGRYRWPHGLELRRAWRFTEPWQDFASFTKRHFGMDAAQSIVPLLPDEAEPILALPREEIPLLQSMKAATRIHGADVARSRAAPPPTTKRVGVMHMRRAPASTYLMKIEGASPIAFKIGWAFDVEQRRRDFNQSAMPEIGGLHYRIAMHQQWETATEAFRMEQALLRAFNIHRHPQNREIITTVPLDTITAEWTNFVIGSRRR